MRCLKVEPKGGVSHTPSPPIGSEFDLAADKDFMDLLKKSVGISPFRTSHQSTGAAGQVGQSSTGEGSALTALMLGVVGEVGFIHSQGSTVSSFQGGVRLTAYLRSKPELSPFFQFLAGIEHCGVCSSNDFSIQPGFGVVYALRNSPLGIIGQLDFRRFPSSAFSEPEIRFAGGVSFTLGGR